MEPSLFWIVAVVAVVAVFSSAGAASSVGALLADVSGAGAPERFLGGGGWKGVQEGGPRKLPALQADFTASQYCSHLRQFALPVGPAES